MFGLDTYPNDFTKAAALLQSLARDHAFVDGNKRTAWAAAWTFLHLNGVGLAVDFDVDDAEAFMNQVATDTDPAVDVVASKLIHLRHIVTVTIRACAGRMVDRRDTNHR